jgi:hypothetical protein
MRYAAYGIILCCRAVLCVLYRTCVFAGILGTLCCAYCTAALVQFVISCHQLNKQHRDS